MTYPIETKDGIVIEGIPEEVPVDDQRLKDQVARMRASGQKHATFEVQQLAQQPSAAAPAPEAPAQPGVIETAVNELPQNLGVAARGIVQGAASLPMMAGDLIAHLINLVPGANVGLPSEGLNLILSKLGVPEAQSETQKILEIATGALGGAATGTALGGALKGAANAGANVVPGAEGFALGAAGDALAANPMGQAISGVAGGMSAEGARLAGAPPWVQAAAGLAGGAVGGVAAGASSRPRSELLDAAEKIKVPITTTDVFTPKTFAAKWLRSMDDKLPMFGTGAVRKRQQAARSAAVSDIVEQYNAGDINPIVDDIAADLLAKNSAYVDKWYGKKMEVIDRLNDAPPYVESSTNVSNDTFASIWKSFGGIKPKEVERYLINELGDRGADKELVAKVLSSPAGGRIAKLIQEGNGEFDEDVLDILRADPDFAQRIGFDASGISLKYVPMNATTAKIDEQIEYLKGLKSKHYAPVIAILEDWKQATQGQTLKNVETLRKDIGKISFDAPELAGAKDTGKKVLKSIYPSVNEDMGAHIKRVGSQADYTKWKDANAKLAQGMDELELPVLKRVMESAELSPEDVNKMLFSIKPSDMRALYRNLNPAGQKSARAAVIARAAEKAGDTVSPEKFVNELKRLSNEVGVYFSDDDLAQVNGLMKVINATRHAGEAAVIPATGVQAVPLLVPSVIGSVFGGGLPGFIKGAAATAGLGSVMKIYESVPVRNILMNLSRVKEGGPEAGKLFTALAAAIEGIQRQQSGDTTPAPRSRVQMKMPN